MTWYATTSTADVAAGGHFQIMERLHAPDLPRPAYTVGHAFLIEKVAGGAVEGKIVATSGDTFDVELPGGRKLRFTPAPQGTLEISEKTGGVPTEGYLAEPV